MTLSSTPNPSAVTARSQMSWADVGAAFLARAKRGSAATVAIRPLHSESLCRPLDNPSHLFRGSPDSSVDEAHGRDQHH